MQQFLSLSILNLPPPPPPIYITPLICKLLKIIVRDKNSYLLSSQLKYKSYIFLHQLKQVLELVGAWYTYTFAHDRAWYTPALDLINIQLQLRNQTPQASIGLYFISIVISESHRKKSNKRNQKLSLLVPNIKCFCNLRVAGCELRVGSCNFRKINLRVASSFLRVAK